VTLGGLRAGIRLTGVHKLSKHRKVILNKQTHDNIESHLK